MKRVSITTVAFAVLLLAVAGVARAGEPCLACRTYVQAELKLSDAQKQKMRELPGFIQKTMKAPDAHEKLFAFLKQTLNAVQLKRFHQLELQHEGPPALLRPEIARELRITVEQRMQFIGLIQALQKKIEPLIKESQTGGNPQVIRPEVIMMRQDCQGKMEALLSGAQKKRWKAMIGKPFDTLR